MKLNNIELNACCKRSLKIKTLIRTWMIDLLGYQIRLWYFCYAIRLILLAAFMILVCLNFMWRFYT